MNMKKININIKVVSLLIFAVLFSACELVGSIDKIQPDYKLTDKNVISDVKSAEANLNGVYSSWRTLGIGWMRHFLDVLTGSQLEVRLTGMDGFKSNQVEDTNYGVENNYAGLYNVVNNASSFLYNLSEKPKLPGLSDERRAEMEGEVKYLRAQANLMLLRQYGEFFNTASVYGIVLYPENKPIRDNTPIKRSTVAESYQHILNDLDDAIANAPENNEHYKVSSTTAKALKARVLLYMKDFAGASALAKEVLDEAPAAGYAIEEDYKEMFKNSFESSEMLFALYSEYPDEIYRGGEWNQCRPGATSGKIATTIAESGEKDRRYVQTFEDLDPENLSVQNNKYYFWFFEPGKYDSHFYIRLAEMYYIIAEAETRLGNFDEARDALKEIICLDRAGYSPEYVDAIANGELLTMILHHKWMEFTTENNEEWFDLVRYHSWDNFEIKPYYVTSDAHLLLPIPRKALSGNNLLEQNPGYQTV